MSTKRLPNYLTKNEFARLMEVTYKEKHKAAFVLGFSCGLRISEVTNLKQVDIDRGTGMFKVVQGKGGKDRYIPFNKRVARYFKEVPIELSHRTLQISFKRAVKRAGIKKDVHFHSLRHSCATNRLSDGWNLKQVQQLLGHENIATTNVYLHINPEDLKKKMDESSW